MQAQISQHILVQRAYAMHPTLKKHGPRIEKDRRVTPEIVQSLASQGFFRMLVPEAYGGEEVHPWVMVETLEALAQGDGATSWCVMTGSTTGLLSAYTSPQGAEALWAAQPDVIMAGIFAPMGQAIPVEGGYRLTGRWSFASGCENSTWRMGGALIMDEDGPRRGPDGAPIILSLFFQSEDSQVHDTWHVSGLRGTGSHDISVKDLFVPEHYTTCLTHGEVQAPGTLYRFPVFGLLATSIAAIGLGIARAALDHFIELCHKKKSRGSKKTIAHQELTQFKVAEAEAHWLAARAFLQQTLDEVWNHAEHEGEISLQDKARVRMAANFAVKACTQVVDDAYHAGGGSSIYDTSPLQRYFRDMHVLTQHIMVSTNVNKTVGRALLGLDVHTGQL